MMRFITLILIYSTSDWHTGLLHALAKMLSCMGLLNTVNKSKHIKLNKWILLRFKEEWPTVLEGPVSQVKEGLLTNMLNQESLS